MQHAPIKLPPATPDQVEYLEKIRRATEDYDRSAIVGGPQKEKAMASTFWVIETARQTYWEGRQVGDKAVFTDKIAEAIKFGDGESAERVRCWLLESQPGSAGSTSQKLRSVEHSFIPQTLT